MFRTLWRGLLAALWILAASAASSAAVGSLDVHREAVDETRYPWSAIGKLFNETGAECSGVVVSRNEILTAAHCLFNYRTRRFIAADALHFLVGYRTGHYSAHARIARYELGPGFDPLNYQQTSKADWAILTVMETLPAAIEPLRLSGQPLTSGTKAVLVGYPQDRAYAMTADRDCELRDDTKSQGLLRHTCRGVHGYSGAPILITDDIGSVEVAGIQIATTQADGAREMIAIPARAISRSGDVEASGQCVARFEGAPDVWISDIQVRLDVERLNLSAAYAATVDEQAPAITAGVGSTSFVVAAQ